MKPSLLASAIESHKRQSFSEAARLYELVLETDPKNVTALHMLGVVFYKGNKLKRAIKLLKSAMLYSPKNAAIFYDLGLCFLADGLLNKALDNFTSALSLNPALHAAEFQKGLTLKKLGLITDARRYLFSFAQKNPMQPHGYIELGNLEKELGHLKDALAYYDLACVISPKLLEGWHNKGATLADLGHTNDGIKALKKAISIDANHLKSYIILAQLISERDGPKSAIKIIDLAIKIDPSYLWLHITKADILFELYDLAGGWREYAWRNKKYAGKHIVKSDLKIFNRSEILNSNIFLTAEQGLGEQILFSSMLPDLLRDAKTVCLHCEERLIPIFRRSFQGLRLINHKPSSVEYQKCISEMDIILPLGSLGNIYRKDFSSFPSHEGYLIPDKERVNYFRQKYLTLAGGKPVLGISWRSFNPLSFWRKSAPLVLWNDILLRDDVFVVNVQYGAIQKEVEGLALRPNALYTDGEITDDTCLEDTLAQIAAMDLLVSTSNTSAHMAGALNLRTILLLPNKLSHLWYWFPKMVVNPWYPSVTNVLQNQPLLWQQSISDANHYIDQIFSQHI